MWKELFDLVKKVFQITKTLNQHSENIAKLQKQVEELADGMIKITNALTNLRLEVMHNARLEESEREKIILQLENILLKAGIEPTAKPQPKKLPPKRPQNRRSKKANKRTNVD